MAFGIPGGSTNMTYFVLCGGGLTAAVVYAYKTVNGDSERYEDRLANMGANAKVEEAPEAVAPPAEVVTEAADPPSEVEPEAAAPPAEVEPEAGELQAEDPAPELAPVEEAAPATEVVTESVPATEEADAETPAEPVVECGWSEEAAAGDAETVTMAEILAITEAIEGTSAEVPAEESAGMAEVDEVPPAPPAEAETGPTAEAEAVPAAELAA